MTPSNIYLISLQSKTSRVTMASLLNKVAGRLQKGTTHETFDWSKINYQSVMELMNIMKEEGKHPDTINTYLAAIKGVAKESWRSKLLDVESYQFIKEIKRMKGSRSTKGRSLEVKELRSMIKVCDDNTLIGLRDAAIIGLVYGAGLRRQEAADLQISNIDLNKGTVHVLGKGNKERINTLGGKSLTLLKSYLKIRGTQQGSLFVRGKKGNKLTTLPISDQSIYDIVVKRYKQAGLSKLSPHDLRRSYATNLLENDEDVFTVMKLLGHSSVNTTKTYDKRSDVVKDIAARRLPF